MKTIEIYHFLRYVIYASKKERKKADGETSPFFPLHWRGNLRSLKTAIGDVWSERNEKDSSLPGFHRINFTHVAPER